MCDINLCVIKQRNNIEKCIFLDMRHPRRCGVGRGTTVRGRIERGDFHQSTPSTKGRPAQLQN